MTSLARLVQQLFPGRVPFCFNKYLTPCFGWITFPIADDRNPCGMFGTLAAVELFLGKGNGEYGKHRMKHAEY